MPTPNSNPLIDYFQTAATNQRGPDGFTILDKSKLTTQIGSLAVTPPDAFRVLNCGCLELKVDGIIITHTHHDIIHRGPSVCNIRQFDIKFEDDEEEEEDEEF